MTTRLCRRRCFLRRWLNWIRLMLRPQVPPLEHRRLALHFAEAAPGSALD